MYILRDSARAHSKKKERKRREKDMNDKHQKNT
jgi:hypothetical protein